jgi:hypothetical protein
MSVIIGRVRRYMMVDHPPVVMPGFVRRVGMQMDERRRERTRLQAEAHEQHTDRACHVRPIVAHLVVGVKRRGLSICCLWTSKRPAGPCGRPAFMLV